jgi:hypothetical protein
MAALRGLVVSVCQFQASAQFIQCIPFLDYALTGRACQRRIVIVEFRTFLGSEA